MTEDGRTPTDEDRKDAETLWHYHQMGHQLRGCDAAIGLGSHDIGVAAFAAGLYHRGLFPVLVFSGADNPTFAELFPDGEAVGFRRRAVELGVPESAILIDPEATNTSLNITNSRRVLQAAGHTPKSVLLVSMPYMQRRAYATARLVWPEAEVLCASEQVGYPAYVKNIGVGEALVIDQLVGDTQRIILYPERGFSIAQDVPDRVRSALDRLCAHGYTSRLLT